MTRRLASGGLALAAALFASCALSEEAPDAAAIGGIWQNPENSVHVEIRSCGQPLCGFVVWANARAKADARRGGTDELIGVQLFRDLVRQKSGAWRGKVFVPDLHSTFTGAAVLIDDHTLRTTGCLVARVLCRSQVWTRVQPAESEPPPTP